MWIRSLLLATTLVIGCAPAGEGPEGAPYDDETALDGDSLTGAQPTGSLLATTASVNLREGPSTGDDIIEVLPSGTTVELLSGQPQNGFYRVKHAGKIGYCSGKYLKVTQAPVSTGETLPGAPPVGSLLATTASVNLREGPSTSGDIIEVLPSGAQVELLATQAENGFYRVRHGGNTGYCSGKYLKVAQPSDPTPTPPPSGDAPTAAEILAALGSGCDEVTNGRYALDSGGSAKVPICQTSGAVYWTADLDVDCDGKSSSVCNKSTDGSFQSQTAATDSKGNYLDAATLPYVVVPLASSRFNYKNAGLALGSVVAVIYQGKVEYGIIGDLGPSSIIGEASYAMAKRLGINPNPSTGGVGSGVTYVAFTGTSARVSKKENHDEAVSIGQSKASALVNK